MGYIVYVHTTPNNKKYVGITKQSVDDRWKNGLGYTTQTLFHRAIQKYGWNNITHEIVANDLSKDDACALEVQLIAKYKTNNPEYGYNRTSGGDGTCEFSHLNPHDDEWRKKVSLANTGKKRTEAAKQKMREAKLGKHRSEETKQKISKAHKDGKLCMSEACRSASVEARRISIIQMDANGNELNRWKSLSEAANYLGVSVSYISILCSGKQKSNKYILKKENKNGQI